MNKKQKNRKLRKKLIEIYWQVRKNIVRYISIVVGTMVIWAISSGGRALDF